MDEGGGGSAWSAVSLGIEHLERVGTFLKHLIDGHGKLLRDGGLGVVPVHDRLAFQEQYLRSGLDGQNL